MSRPWLGSYPPGIPTEADIRLHRSLPALLAHSCALQASRPAFSCIGGTLTYAELDHLSRRFAEYLARIGLARHDRVAIMLPNLLQYPVAFFGTLRAGCVVVNVNPLYTPDELAGVLADSGAVAIVVLESFAHTVHLALDRSRVQTVIVTSAGDLLPGPRRELVNAAVRYVKRAVPRWHMPGAVRLRDALAQESPPERMAADLHAADLALLQYTGGTTGRPKGAMLTHGNILANVEQIHAWMRPRLDAGGETVITALPLYHIFALTANLMLFTKLGGHNVLVTDARDLSALVRTLRATRHSAITGVNSLSKALLGAPGFAQAAARNAGTLKIAIAGGMAVERSVAERWHAITGIALTEGYGLT